MEVIEIPFGAKDSELKGWEYTIPEGFTAEIKDGKVIVKEKENEDERIRKDIISHFESIKALALYDNQEESDGTISSCNEKIAWLEKQKQIVQWPNLSNCKHDCKTCFAKCIYRKEQNEEQKPNIELIQRSWYMEGYHDGEFGREPKWFIKTGEGGPKYELNPQYGQPITECPKPAEWSEEDEKILNSILNDLRQGVIPDEEDQEWLKSLRPQPKQNANGMITPDKEFFQWIYDRLVNVHKENPNVDYMISFKRRIEELSFDQPHWKPTEEQMEALSDTLAFMPDTFKPKCTLVTLQNDLKKQYGTAKNKH